MKTPIDMYVIQKVKEKRIEHGMSQEQLSIAIGFKSNGFVAQVESNNFLKRYNIQHINKFASIFRCSPKEFLPEIPL